MIITYYICDCIYKHYYFKPILPVLVIMIGIISLGGNCSKELLVIEGYVMCFINAELVIVNDFHAE